MTGPGVATTESDRTLRNSAVASLTRTGSGGTVGAVSRSCARPGCGRTASATLSYAYADSIVWLEDLAPEGHPMIHDLCESHANAVRVPRGWELRDERRLTGGQSSFDLIGA